MSDSRSTATAAPGRAERGRPSCGPSSPGRRFRSRASRPFRPPPRGPAASGTRRRVAGFSRRFRRFASTARRDREAARSPPLSPQQPAKVRWGGRAAQTQCRVCCARHPFSGPSPPAPFSSRAACAAPLRLEKAELQRRICGGSRRSLLVPSRLPPVADRSSVILGSWLRGGRLFSPSNVVTRPPGSNTSASAHVVCAVGFVPFGSGSRTLAAAPGANSSGML